MSKYNRRLLRRSIQEQIESCMQASGKSSVVSPITGQRVPAATHFKIDCPNGSMAVIDLTDQRRFQASIDQLPQECFVGTASRQQVFDAISAERKHQDDKWGVDKPQSLAGFLLVIERELAEAKEGWIKNNQGRDAPLNELVQVAACCVAALERYGVTGSTISHDDTPDPQPEPTARGTNSRGPQ